MKKALKCIFTLLAVTLFYSANAAVPVVKSDTVAAVQDTTVRKVVAEGPNIDFGKDTEYDFGKVKEKGGKQTGSIAFKNSGNKPLIITKVLVSCKCVSISYPKKPVMPGAEDKITITYDPKKQKGVFHKAIQVYSNDPRARVIVFVKGEVVE